MAACCSDLSGVWQNELGSTMSIWHFPEDTTRISGKYHTTVESKEGAADHPSPVAGLVKPVQGGCLVSWNVLWKHGKSMTTWVGQCMENEGKVVIYTTWALRSLKKPEERWMTTRVNQDTFWRVEGDFQTSLTPDTDSGDVNKDILGKWTSVSGDAFNISFAAKTGKLEGDYLSPEKERGEVALFGATDGTPNYTALGFTAAGTTFIKGWTGHIYNPQEVSQPVLETSWLAHSFSDSCKDPRRFVSFGMDYYTQPISPDPSSDA